METTKELRLRRPVQLGDEAPIEVLTLKEPTAKQYRFSARGESGVAGDMILVAEVTGLKLDVIEKLSSRDFIAVSDYLGRFTRLDPAQMAEDAKAEDLFQFELLCPVQIGNVKLDKLTLKEPTAAQLRQAARAESSVATDLILVHLAANIDPTLAEAMSLRDHLRAARWLGNFTRSTPPPENA